MPPCIIFVKSSMVDVFILVFEGSPESEDCLVIKKIGKVSKGKVVPLLN
jgi:hypothetical protein